MQEKEKKEVKDEASHQNEVKVKTESINFEKEENGSKHENGHSISEPPTKISKKEID